MKQIMLMLISCLFFVGCEEGPVYNRVDPVVDTTGMNSTKYDFTPDSVLWDAYVTEASDKQVLIKGRVTKLLADDTVGDKHQQFIVMLANSYHTLKIAHNIDLAPRVANLKGGDVVFVYGEYEWNDLGGVVHWTHHDPSGIHVDGWIEHQNVKYQ